MTLSLWSKFKKFTSIYNLSIIYSFIVSLLFIFLLYKKKNKYIYLLVIIDLIINKFWYRTYKMAFGTYHKVKNISKKIKKK